MTVAAKTLAEALAAAQAEMPAVGPDKQADVPTKSGGTFTYSYVSLGNLIAKTRPFLNKHGISIVQSTELADGRPVLRTVLMHTSGETLDAGVMPLYAEGGMQQLGGAITYARRYAWAAALGISDQDDTDAQHVDAPSEAEKPSASQPQKPVAKPPNASVISNPQRKRLWAVANEHTVPEELVRQIVMDVAGVDSTQDIPKAKYDQIIEQIQAQAVPF